MVREYIGARYVPKFMGLYDNTQVYEALCVVDNGLGTSYISKVPTPAGTPLTDTDHWAIYGASSGAIINLQNQIDDMKDGDVSGSLQNQINAINNISIPGIENDIGDMDDLTETDLVTAINNIKANTAKTGWSLDAMAEKTVILIGDSWGVTNGSSINNWCDLLEPYFYKAYKAAQGGYSFNLVGASYITLLNSITVDPGDHIDAIIAIGGANGVTTGDVTAFINACKTAYPDAEIVLGCNGPSIYNSAYYARERIVEKESAAALVKYFKDLWRLFVKSPLSNWRSDYYHMVDYTTFVNNLVSYLTMGYYRDTFPLLTIYPSAVTSKGSSMSPYFLDLGSRGASRNGDDYMFYITFTKGTNFNAASDSISLTNGTAYELCQIDCPNVVAFYSNTRPDSEVNNKGFKVYDDSNFNLLLIQDGVSPYPKLVLYAKNTGTFTKAQLFPNSSIHFMLQSKGFNFASPNDYAQNCIAFTPDNI